jgi:AraC-like DNA-binding protein
LRVDALQRVTASFAMARVNVLGGRIGDEGAFLLVCSPSPHPERARVQLETLAERVGALVRRRLGFSLVVGVSERANVGAELPDRYDESVWAVQWALHQRQHFAIYGARVGRETVGRTEGLYESSRTLCESFGAGRVRDTAVDAERVVKDVLRLTTANVEAARSHFLELLWEMASLVEQRHAAEAITIVEQRERVTDRLERARSLRELTSSFAESVAELARLLEPPRGATVRAKLERARRIIAKEGYRQSLDFEALAVRVGLSRSYLSRTFKRTFGIAISDFVLQVRLEHSRKLLRGTSLNVAAVSRAAGFSSASYFHQAFRRAERQTPEGYRAALAEHR